MLLISMQNRKQKQAGPGDSKGFSAVAPRQGRLTFCVLHHPTFWPAGLYWHQAASRNLTVNSPGTCSAADDTGHHLADSEPSLNALPLLLSHFGVQQPPQHLSSSGCACCHLCNPCYEILRRPEPYLGADPLTAGGGFPLSAGTLNPVASKTPLAQAGAPGAPRLRLSLTSCGLRCPTSLPGAPLWRPAASAPSHPPHPHSP